MPSEKQAEVVTTNESERWMEILDEVGEYDFYHLPAYQRLTEARVGGRATMPVFRCDGVAMAFPLLVRDIAIPGVNCDGLHDAACVPGLTGPVISQRDMSDDVRHVLMQQFQEYLRQNRIVSVYSRLHILLGQDAFLSGYGQLRHEGTEVTVDLTAPPDTQYARYRENHRRDIRKLKNQGIVCEQAGPECLDDFLGIYYDTMDRVGARRVYYHDRDYFEYLLDEMSEYSRLSVCRDGRKIACAGIFVTCNRRVHYLWGGTASEHHDRALSKLMLDEVRVWANGIGVEVFHLGGGIPSLCHFKMGFGGREHDYFTWRYVADQDAYDELCRQAFLLAGKRPDDGYFPEYRSPSLGLS